MRTDSATGKVTVGLAESTVLAAAARPELSTGPYRIVVRHSKGPPERGDSMGATENPGFSAKYNGNSGLIL